MARRDLAAVPDRARLEIEFEQPYLLGPLFGDYDRHLITIEQRLDVHIAARGNRVQIEGDPDAASRARAASSASPSICTLLPRAAICTRRRFSMVIRCRS